MASCPNNSVISGSSCYCIKGYTQVITSTEMECVCDQTMFNVKAVIYNLGNSYCCPIGSSFINGTCGCDSSGTVKMYVGVASSTNINSMNTINIWSSIPVF